MDPKHSEWLAAARATVEGESAALAEAARRLDDSLVRAVNLILRHDGKVVVSGVGKSGLVGQKIVATLCSTGSPAVFLHPSEALHGDLGVYSPGDPTILVSKSGATEELVRLVPTLKQFHSPLIGLLGASASPLARQVDVTLDASVRREADPHNLTPTSSTAVAAALGDGLCVALMQARGFTPDDFHRFHPGGRLGAMLRLTVGDVMHADAPRCSSEDSAICVVRAMTANPLGAACVVAPDGALVGLITDGDIRRAIERHGDIRELRSAEIMTPDPVSVTPETGLRQAVSLMEDRPRQVSVLPVVETKAGRCVGLLRLHDLYQVGDR